MHTMSKSTLLLSLLLLAGRHSHAADLFADPSPARVVYVTESTVYLDAGSAAGIGEGDRIDLTRGGEVIAEVEVRYLSTGKSACFFVERTEWPVPGDLASPSPPGRAPGSFSSEAPAPDLPADITPAAVPVAAGPSVRNLGIRGRVGVRYWALDDRTGIGEDYARPSVSFKLEGKKIGGSDWGFHADVRARRTYRHLTDGTNPSSTRNRVYRAEVSWDPADSRWRLSAGRQVSPDFAAVSLFDGLLARYETADWSFGAFTGTQPDAATRGYSTEVREIGGFASFDHRRGPGTRWTASSGLVGSYEGSDLNREYLFLRGRYRDRRTFVNITQEIDINRSWKADAGETGLSPTSTYASLRHQIFTASSIEGGYDNRRRVRLYRDRVTPETDFDDSYRQGVWVGATQKFDRRSRIGVRARSRSGGIWSFTLTAKTEIPRLYRVHLRTRNTRFENGHGEGWFHSLTAGLPIGRRIRWEMTRGLRREEILDDPEGTRSLHWTSMDLDLTLARHWYLSVSGEINRGAGENHRTIYSSTLYRF